jgi:hypothetical protein
MSHWKTFVFLIAKRNNEGCLVSKTNPDLRIFIETAYIEPTNPRNVLQFGTPKKWQPAKH